MHEVPAQQATCTKKELEINSSRWWQRRGRHPSTTLTICIHWGHLHPACSNSMVDSSHVDALWPPWRTWTSLRWKCENLNPFNKAVVAIISLSICCEDSSSTTTLPIACSSISLSRSSSPARAKSTKFYRQNWPIIRIAPSQAKIDSRWRPRANTRSRRFSATLNKPNQRLTVPPIMVRRSSSRNPLSINSNARWRSHRSECDRTQISKNSSHSPSLYPISNSCHPRAAQNKASATESVHQTSTN